MVGGGGGGGQDSNKEPKTHQKNKRESYPIQKDDGAFHLDHVFNPLLEKLRHFLETMSTYIEKEAVDQLFLWISHWDEDYIRWRELESDQLVIGFFKLNIKNPGL